MDITNKQAPFFSICIPVYNTKLYLHECVESVLKQTERDYEIILVDDGSTDESGSICDEYADQYSMIRVIHKKNEGLFLARCSAVEVATGRYLLFLDSDDFFLPNTLSTVKAGILSSGADLVVYDYSRVYSDGQMHILTEEYQDGQRFFGESKKKFYNSFLIHSSLNSLCRKCILKSLYSIPENKQEYIGVNQAEDRLASFPCLDGANCILYIKKSLYGYRINRDSITSNIKLKNYKDAELVYQRADEYMKKWNTPSDVVSLACAGIIELGFECVISTYRRFKNGKTSAEEFEEAIQYIAGTERYTASWEICKKHIAWRHRVVAKLIIGRKVRCIRIICSLMSSFWSVKAEMKKLLKR